MPATPDWPDSSRPRIGGHLWIVFTVTFSAYCATLPRAVTLEDAGIFTMAGVFGGFAHPPCYPVHSLLAGLVSRIPAGSVIVRVELLSALCAALACCLLWRVLHHWLNCAISAYLGALAAYQITAAFEGGA